MQSTKIIALCSFLATPLLVSNVDAQLVQVPLLVAEFGSSDTNLPFALHGGPYRFQQIYAASAFPHGGIIDKIKFRSDEKNGIPYGPTDIDIQVAFAYAATEVHAASTIFANNIGEDFTIVLDGVITESDDGTKPPPFDFVVDVANTFNYDPTQGGLLLQILVRNTKPGFAIFDAGWSFSIATTLYASGLNASEGRLGAGRYQVPHGVFTQFEFTQVPEPSAFALLGVAGIFAIQLRRQRTR